MTTVTLTTTKGTPITLDAEDAQLLAGKKINESKPLSISVYSPVTKRAESLGRFLLGLMPDDGRHVISKDGDRTDFRRENLLIVSREKSLSLRSRRRSEESRWRAGERLQANAIYSRPKTTSKYRGVTMIHPNGDTSKQLWQMRVTVQKQKFSSLHATEEEAARAYDAVREKCGLSAVNFPG